MKGILNSLANGDKGVESLSSGEGGKTENWGVPVMGWIGTHLLNTGVGRNWGDRGKRGIFQGVIVS